jgi:hypothetical protein
MNVPDTLAVGRNASLTLGTDSLVVLGMPSAQATGTVEAYTLQMKRSWTAKAQAAAVCLLLAVSSDTYSGAKHPLTQRRE